MNGWVRARTSLRPPVWPAPFLLVTACSIVGEPEPAGDRRIDAGPVRPGDGSPDEDDAGAAACAPELATGPLRGGDAPVFVRDSYDYVPTLMHDGVYRMWWC